MKKALKIALLSVLGLVIVAGVLMWMEFGPLVKGANSCVKLDNGLYYMEYKGDDRYDKLCQRFDQMHGVMSKKQLTEAIAVVSQPQREGFLGTAWTMVMDLSHPSVTYYSRRHFSKSFHFALGQQNVE